MTGAFWLSYALLWVMVVGGSLLTFALLREIGRLQLQSPQSVTRDGLDVGATVPDVRLSRRDADAPLSSFMQRELNLLIFALPNCSFCTEAVNVTRRWIEANPTTARATVLVNATEFGDYADIREDQDLAVTLIDSRDVLEIMRVRVAPFAYLADANGRILAKGVLNTDADLAQLLASARTNSESDFPDNLIAPALATRS